MTMTTIKDVPLCLLTQDTVAKLACLDTRLKNCVQQDKTSRDFGWELFKYICYLDEPTRSKIVYRSLTVEQTWSAIKAALDATCLPTSVYYIPFTGALNISMNGSWFNIESQCTTMCYFRHSLSCLPKTHLSVFSKQSVLYDALCATMNDICRSAIMRPTPDITYMTIDWVTESYCFFVVNLESEQIFVTSYFPIDSNEAAVPSDIVIHDVTSTYARDALKALCAIAKF